MTNRKKEEEEKKKGRGYRGREMGEIEEKGGRKGAQMKLAPRTWLRVHGVRVCLYMTGGAWGVCGVCVFLERRERRAHQVSSLFI